MTTMQSNIEVALKSLHDCNPTIQMWRRFTFSVIFKNNFEKYFKLVEFAIDIIIGNVEDECTFSTIIFMKSKLRNHLITNLNFLINMYAQGTFILEMFPFHIANTESKF
jgi:hypothetical protein